MTGALKKVSDSTSALVRFNQKGRDGLRIGGTEIYFPLAPNMLIYMHGEGEIKEFRMENDRTCLRGLNTYMCKKAERYIFGMSDVYLKRIARNRS